jgi:transcriptional regulator with XRE-family HTH domain
LTNCNSFLIFLQRSCRTAISGSFNKEPFLTYELKLTLLTARATLLDLAAVTGLSKTMVSYILNGHTRGSAQSRLAIADRLGVSLSFLDANIPARNSYLRQIKGFRLLPDATPKSRKLRRKVA